VFQVPYEPPVDQSGKNTGDHRKYAVRLLDGLTLGAEQPRRCREPATYSPAVVQTLPSTLGAVSRFSDAISEEAPRLEGVTLNARAKVRHQDLQEVAFYYPGHLWRNSEWIKTLLLFFDGVSLLIPEYKQGEPEIADPVLAAPLREQGLLHYLIADRIVDKQATEKLITSRCKSERGEDGFLGTGGECVWRTCSSSASACGSALIDASADAVARHVPGPAGCWRSRRVRPSAPCPAGLDSDTAGGHDTAWRH
jgi:hypothetical protein